MMPRHDMVLPVLIAAVIGAAGATGKQGKNANQELLAEELEKVAMSELHDLQNGIDTLEKLKVCNYTTSDAAFEGSDDHMKLIRSTFRSTQKTTSRLIMRTTELMETHECGNEVDAGSLLNNVEKIKRNLERLENPIMTSMCSNLFSANQIRTTVLQEVFKDCKYKEDVASTLNAWLWRVLIAALSFVLIRNWLLVRRKKEQDKKDRTCPHCKLVLHSVVMKERHLANKVCTTKVELPQPVRKAPPRIELTPTPEIARAKPICASACAGARQWWLQFRTLIELVMPQPRRKSASKFVSDGGGRKSSAPKATSFSDKSRNKGKARSRSPPATTARKTNSSSAAINIRGNGSAGASSSSSAPSPSPAPAAPPAPVCVPAPAPVSVPAPVAVEPVVTSAVRVVEEVPTCLPCVTPPPQESSVEVVVQQSRQQMETVKGAGSSSNGGKKLADNSMAALPMKRPDSSHLTFLRELHDAILPHGATVANTLSVCGVMDSNIKSSEFLGLLAKSKEWVDVLHTAMEVVTEHWLQRQVSGVSKWWTVVQTLKKQQAAMAEAPEQNEDEEAAMCTICFEAPKDAALVPCGHRYCHGCAQIAKDKRKCFICNAEVVYVLRTFG